MNGFFRRPRPLCLALVSPEEACKNMKRVHPLSNLPLSLLDGAHLAEQHLRAACRMRCRLRRRQGVEPEVVSQEQEVLAAAKGAVKRASRALEATTATGAPAVRTQVLGLDRQGAAYWALQCGPLLAGEPLPQKTDTHQPETRGIWTQALSTVQQRAKQDRS